MAYIPSKNNDGLRRYGTWAGNENGTQENTHDCIMQVSDSMGWHSYQCRRKRGFGPKGLFCKQHAKQVRKDDPNI